MREETRVRSRDSQGSDRTNRRESISSSDTYEDAADIMPTNTMRTTYDSPSATMTTNTARTATQDVAERPSSYMLKFLFPFFASFNIKGLNLAYGALMYGYRDIQISSPTSYFKLSWIGSLYTAALLASFPLAHLITDLLKSKKASAMKGLAPVVVTFGVCFRSALFLGIASLTSSTTLVFLHGILLGLTDGILYSLSIITLDENFYSNPLIWGAIIRIGAGLGGLIYTAILRTCLSTVHFDWGLRIIALCGAGTMIPSLFFMPSVQRKGLTPRDQTPRDEENQQRGSEDQTINRESPSRSLSKILIFEDIIGEQLKKSQLTIGNRRQITGNKGPSFTFAILGLFFAFSSLYYGYHFIVIYGVHAAHQSPADSMLLVVEMCACHVFGIVISTILKRVIRDQLGVLTFAILCTSQTIFTWIGADQNAGLKMFVCFYGFYSAAVDSMHLTCQLTYANSYYDSDQSERMRFKVLYFFLAMGLGVVVGSVAAGCLLDYYSGRFWSADLLSAGGLFAGSICFLAAVAMLKRRPGNSSGSRVSPDARYSQREQAQFA